ncbi:MAG TPA: TonB-dependent receptor, partial [Flavobacteriaceae bacterium]|nr:TonB-dependent receptor [Flavobacteriaceae bacterium]
EYRNEQISSTSIKNHTRDNVGFYAEYKTDITPKLNVNVGTYVNYNSQYGWQAFPGIDASYAVNSNLKLMVNAGT